MRKIYEASGKLKRFLIEDENDANSYYKCVGGNDQIEIEDFVMIGSIDKELLKKKIDIKWCLNGLLPEKFDTKDITIIEPLSEHYDEKLININETDTYFDGEIVLSSSAIILMSVELYEELLLREEKI